MRRRLPAGLRWRLLLALLATSAVTLGVAALVVLPPLQDRLRDQSVERLEDAVRRQRGRVRAELAALTQGRRALDGVRHAALRCRRTELQHQSRARVLVLHDHAGCPATRRSRRRASSTTAIHATSPRRVPRGIEGHADGAVTEHRRRHRPRGRPLGVDGTLVVARRRAASSPRSPRSSARSATASWSPPWSASRSRRCWPIALSSTLLRRLARLRAAALRITDEGPDAQMPHDERRDEVGDLARALARMQEELRRQEAARRAFVSTASHELRTPLTMLQGTMELLEDDLRAGRLDELDALRQVRPRASGSTASPRSPASCSTSRASTPRCRCARSRWSWARSSAPSRPSSSCARASARRSIDVALPDGAVLGARRPGRDRPRRADPARQRDALRPARHAGAVEAHTRDHGRAVITVTDRGPGIPPEEREHIFERFHRGSGAGSAGGFGLGLAIGRELARRMGGELASTTTATTARASRSRCAPPARPPDGPRGDRDRVSA